MILSERDYTTEEGAQMLARRIRAFWHKHGCEVSTVVAPVEGSRNLSSHRHLIYEVRSDMVDGYPRSVSA